MIKMPNPSQEPPKSYKFLNLDLKDIYVLCTFEINIEIQNWEQGSIKMSNHSQDPLVSSMAPNQDSKDMGVLSILKIMIERQNWEYGCIKDQ